MKVTPLDIRRKEFKRTMRGYADEEVDVFLDEVADEFERLYQENAEMQDRLHLLDEQMQSHAQLKAALEKTLVSAQLQADQITANARKESELIMRDAELKARNIVAESYSETQKVQQTLVQLRHLEEEFRFKFRSLLEAHLRLVEEAPPAVSPARPVMLMEEAGIGRPVLTTSEVDAAPEAAAAATMLAEVPVVPISDLAGEEAIESATTPVVDAVPLRDTEAPPMGDDPFARLSAGSTASALTPADDESTEEAVADDAEPAALQAAAGRVPDSVAALPAESASTGIASAEAVPEPPAPERQAPLRGFFFGRRLDDDDSFVTEETPQPEKNRDFEW